MMDVIGHETIGQEFDAIFGSVLFEQVKEEFAILIREEYLLLMITPLDDVVRHTGNDDPRASRHK